MKTAETINSVCAELGTTKADLAKRMGMLPSSLYRKLARESMTLEEFQIAVEECVAHPCNAEYGNQGVDACGKYVAIDGVLHIGLAHKQNEGCCRHHYNLDNLRHADVMQLAVEHERRTQRRNTAEYYYQQHAQEESQHSILGMRVGILYHVVDELAVLLGIDNALAYTLLIYLVLVQFFAYTVLYECSYKNSYERKQRRHFFSLLYKV